MATTHTVTEAAVKFGKSPCRIRQLCAIHNLGRDVNRRLRLLSATDMKWLARYFSEREKIATKIA